MAEEKSIVYAKTIAVLLVQILHIAYSPMFFYYKMKREDI